MTCDMVLFFLLHFDFDFFFYIHVSNSAANGGNVKYDKLHLFRMFVPLRE